MASEWAYKIARDQRRDVETMANNLDGAHVEGVIDGRLQGLEEAAKILDSAPLDVLLRDGDRRGFTTEDGAAMIRARIEEMRR